MTWVCSVYICLVFFAKLFLKGIYGLATIGQIRDDKLMSRPLDALFSLCLAFYKLYIAKFIYDNQEFVKELKEGVINAISDLSDYLKEKKIMSSIIMNI